MSYPKKLKTYAKILEVFNGIKNVTLAHIQNALHTNDLPCSESSINRAIDDLRGMGIDIKYYRAEKCYKLNNDETTLEHRMIDLMISINFLQETSTNPEDKLKYIDFDERVVSKGAEYLSEIFSALKNKVCIEIEYENFRDAKRRTHLLAPLLLKEYNARWYVFAILKAVSENKKDEAFFFGLDRIKQLKTTDQKVDKYLFDSLPIVQKLKKEKRSEVKPKDIFEDIMGVIFSEEKVQEVVLKIDPAQKHFVTSQPWHHTQEIIKDEPNDFRVCFYLRPNEELIYKILSFSGRAEVLEPQSLRKKIKNILLKTINSYN